MREDQLLGVFKDFPQGRFNFFFSWESDLEGIDVSLIFVHFKVKVRSGASA